MELERIVVGVDGSPGSLAALGWTAGLAAKVGAEVIVVHGFEMPGLAAGLRFAAVPPNVLDEAADSARARTKEALEGEWTEPLRTAGVPHRAVLLDHGGAGVIIDVADAENAGLIVVGTRGHGGFSNLLLGSVSSHLVHHAHRPVAVIPPP
ncbi:MAG: universal stress protein [Actinomycetota bacterium]